MHEEQLWVEHEEQPEPLSREAEDLPEDLNANPETFFFAFFFKHFGHSIFFKLISTEHISSNSFEQFAQINS